MNARTMDHEEAIKNFTAERYLLGELTESDRDAYEEHLFSCPACFEQVKAGTEFVGEIRRIGAEETRHVPDWRKMVHGIYRPALAFAVLFFCTASISIYQAVVIHGPRDPQTVAAQVTLKPDPRGETMTTVTSSRKGSFELRIVVPHIDEVTSWTARAVDASGTQVTSLSRPAEHNSDLQIVFDARMFQSGQYLLVVQGKNRTSGKTELLEQYPFELQLKD